MIRRLIPLLAILALAASAAGCGSTTATKTAASTTARTTQQAQTQQLVRCMADVRKYMAMANDLEALQHPSGADVSKAYADIDAFKITLGELLSETTPTPEQRALMAQYVEALARLQKAALFMGNTTGATVVEAREAQANMQSSRSELAAIPPLMTAICKHETGG